jgi:uncharacterized protein YjgD (DUF1641 family)
LAAPVEFRIYQPADSRADLMRRLEQAPAQHAEALLAAYDLLEKLHEKEILSTLNGLLAAKNVVVDQLSNLVSSREVVNLLRLSLLAGNLLQNIEPDALHRALDQSAAEPPSLWKSLRRMMTSDSRRALAAAAEVLNLVGDALKPKH